MANSSLSVLVDFNKPSLGGKMVSMLRKLQTLHVSDQIQGLCVLGKSASTKPHPQPNKIPARNLVSNMGMQQCD